MFSTISSFPWSFSVPIMAITAMLIFRKPISDLISRSHEVRAGRFALKAKAPDERRMVEEIRQMTAILAEQSIADGEQLDTRRIVIRDSEERPRIIASTVASGEPFLALLDEDGEVRASLSVSPAADPCGVAMLLFRGKRRAPEEMAALIGAELDGSGTVGVRDSSGVWKEMS